MKKFLAILLVCLMAFTVVSCGPEEEAGEFDKFLTAVDQTPASKINVVSKLTTDLGVLNATVETVFNPDGSANLTYSVENFNTDFSSDEVKLTKTGTVVLNKDGSYSDGGEFSGVIGENVVAVNISLDETKFDSYKVQGNVLTASVKAENTQAVFGVEISADVSFMLTISNNRVVSITMNYTVESGAMEVVCSYN